MTFEQATDAIEVAREAYAQQDTTGTIRAITAAVAALHEVQGPLLIHGDNHFRWLEPEQDDRPATAHPTVFTPGLTQLFDEPHRLTLAELSTPPPAIPFDPALSVDLTPPTLGEAFYRHVQPAPLSDPALRVDLPGPLAGPYLDDDDTQTIPHIGGPSC